MGRALYCDKNLSGYRLVLGLGYSLGYWLDPKRYPNRNTNLYPDKVLSQYSVRTQNMQASGYDIVI